MMHQQSAEMKNTAGEYGCQEHNFPAIQKSRWGVLWRNTDGTATGKLHEKIWQQTFFFSGTDWTTSWVWIPSWQLLFLKNSLYVFDVYIPYTGKVTDLPQIKSAARQIKSE